MTTVRARLITFILVMAATAAAIGQVPAQNPANLSGTVLSADQPPQPIAGVIVTLTGGGVRDNVSSITDVTGRFAFSNLTPGRYGVSAAKPAYLTMSYGATRPGRPGATVALAAGQTADIQMALPRGAVISGTIRDQFGKPVPNLQVLFSRADSGSTTGPSLDYIGRTDDRGMYRSFGMMPDDYFVAVLPPSFGTSDLRAPTREENDAVLRRLEQRLAPGPTTSASSATENPISFSMFYYPGTPNATEAQPVRVAAGDDRRGVDIQIMPTRTVKVSGMLAGEMAPYAVRPQLIPSGPAQAMFVSTGTLTMGADGAFTFLNVIPGRYSLVARTGFNPIRVAPGRNAGDLGLWFGAIDIVVGDVDVTGLVVPLRLAPPVSGRVVFQGTTAKPPQNLELVRVGLVPVRTGPPRGGEPTGTTYVTSDSTFKITGVFPGTYTLTATLGPISGWWVRSAMVNGRDIMDLSLEVEETATTVSEILVTFTDRLAEIEGTLSTTSGRPASEFVVIVYPVNREFWRIGARRTRSVRPGSDGAFQIKDLPAGEYLISAVTDADADEWQRPAFLEQLVPASVKVTVTEGQKTRQDLRVGG